MSSNRYEITKEIYITDVISNDDIPSLVKYLNNPNIYANTLRVPYPYTTDDGEAFVQMIKTTSSANNRFFTIRFEENDELIGMCGIHGSDTNNRISEIGYWLGEPYWRRGIASAVITKVLEIAKIQYKNLVRIEAQIYAWNTASRRLIEKCGFTYEGLLRKRVHKNGEDIDIVMYAHIIE
ncbi:hypothetical protein I4U23_000931 [Adineta vaga]|nr:hypothetical protein I4U23_000931 [Adineta vaga]